MLSFEKVEARYLLTGGLDGSEVVGLPIDMKADAWLFIGDHSSSNSEKWNMTIGGLEHLSPDYGEVLRAEREFKLGESYPVTVTHAGTNLEYPDFDYRAWIDHYADPSWTSGSPVPSGPDFFMLNHSALMQRRFFGSDIDRTVGLIEELHFPLFDLDVDTDDDDGKSVPMDNVGEDIRELDNHFGKLVEIYDGDLDFDGIQDNYDYNGVANARFVPITLFLSENLKDAAISSLRIEFDYDDAPASSGDESGLMRIWSKDAHYPRDPSTDFFASGEIVDLGPHIQPGDRITFYVEGVNKSNRRTLYDSIHASVYVTGHYWSGALSDTIHVRPGESLDLAVDSNNDGVIDSNDDAIEDDEGVPGKLVAANLLDRNTNGVPGFADGINLYGNEGKDRSHDFAEAKIAFPEAVDLDYAKIIFSYSGANPVDIQFDQSSGDYWPGSSNAIRLWRKQGSQSRDFRSLADSGDFLAPNIAYSLVDLLDSDNQAELTVYVEGIGESELGSVELGVSVDPDGPEGDVGFVYNDRVKLSVVHLQVVYTDVSGITGTADVARIPAELEPDGATSDWQDGVEDGSLLLMSVVASEFFQDLLAVSPELVSFRFGVFDEATKSFSEGLDGEDGFYVELSDSEFFSESRFANSSSALGALEIANVGEEYLDSGRFVVAARFYRPPVEYDASGDVIRKSRVLPLQVAASGSLEAEGGKPYGITLARPAVVTVHGINSNPSAWNAFMSTYDPVGSDKGLHARYFRVDHSGVDINFQSDGATFGNGELSSVYRFVPQMIKSALSGFRDGVFEPEGRGIVLFSRGGFANRSLLVASQKVDIVAHSYGGLLARWYIEQAGENGSTYNDRRDVKSLITIGTPHLGSPIANIVAEVYKGGLLATAKANGVFYNTLQPQLTTLLELMQQFGDLTTKRESNGKSWHSYQVLSVNSEILDELNETPFHDDVSYGAIIGTNHEMFGFDLYDAFQAVSNVKGTPIDRYLWPWLKILNSQSNSTDSIVPVWSAVLGNNPRNNFFVEAHHGEVHSDATSMRVVMNWLDGKAANGMRLESLVLGSDLRNEFSAQPPVSHRNAYVGSKRVGNENLGAGLNRNAIIKVELDPTDTTSAYGVFNMGTISGDERIIFHTHAGAVGPQANALTGMIQWRHRNSVRLKLAADEFFDNVLHDLGVLSEGELGFDAAHLVGIQDSDWIPFRVTSGLIGRRQDQVLTGPDGVGGRDREEQLVTYHLSVDGDTTEAPAVSGYTKVKLPKFTLDPPSNDANQDGLIIEYSGAITAQINEKRIQSVRVDLMDKDPGLDDLLVRTRIDLVHGANIWEGLLVPWFARIRLRFDESGHIAGSHGSSGEQMAEVYLYLYDDGPGASDQVSPSIDVPQ